MSRKKILFSSWTFRNLMIASLCLFMPRFIALNCKLQNVFSCSLWEFLSRTSLLVKRLSVRESSSTKKTSVKKKNAFH